MPFLIGFSIVFLTLLIILFARALTFKPEKQEAPRCEQIAVDTERATRELSSLIECRTVSYRNKKLEDNSEFERLERVLPSIFPTVFANFEFEKVGRRGLLLRWRGASSKSPTVLMAHYDVVAANGDEWICPPFSPEVIDGFLYGRGTLDTKLTLSTMLHAAERLLEQGFVPASDVYFAFGGDEETDGTGASEIAKLFVERGIYPSLVLDEGGAVVKNLFPRVEKSTAVIGIAEKGLANISYTVRGGGGHASTPKGHTPVSRLARAAARVVSRPQPYRLTETSKTFLLRLSAHSSFGYRFIFANLWLFSPLLGVITRDGGDLSALIRTTVAFTEMHGAEGANVIPSEASLISNSRILQGDTPERLRRRIEKRIADQNVEVRIVSAQNPSPVSRTDCPEYEKIEYTVREIWPDSIISPYLMLACSDARSWSQICDRVYRFSPLEFVGDERFTIHGVNERVALTSIDKSVEFFYRLIKKL